MPSPKNPRTLAWLLLLGGCAYGGGRPVDASIGATDGGAAALDAGSLGFDAGPLGFDAGAPPAGFDAGPLPTGLDAGVPPTPDAGIPDAGYDAGGFDPRDRPLDPLPTGWIERASADFARTTGANGLNVGGAFYVGWRFEVSRGVRFHVREIGFHDRGGLGSVFGAIVRLTGPDDEPDSLDLTTADVVTAPTAGVLLGHRGHVSIPVDTALEPGWYAVVFGSGLAGTSATGEYAGPAHGHVQRPSEQTAFTWSTRTAGVFPQTPGARFYCRGVETSP